ncbi:MAG: hypothetical protein ABW117_08495, partial [Candidatus Sedimenticola sp. 1PA]
LYDPPYSKGQMNFFIWPFLFLNPGIGRILSFSAGKWLLSGLDSRWAGKLDAGKQNRRDHHAGECIAA